MFMLWIVRGSRRNGGKKIDVWIKWREEFGGLSFMHAALLPSSQPSSMIQLAMIII
jgi:hypothetical protein